ncbi:hypothetical protein [Streptomyces parvus]|uniref:Uncharacterized protein n=1 Tax=Streptomyces parvus TaxID=66428 RepID=A0A7K3S9S1_9ACTN|nr:hypothetical protein [Streptomyces parvus]
MLALALGTAPTTAAPSATTQGSGWEPAPSAPWDVPAGQRCAFPVHGEPIVDEVVRRELPPPAEGVTAYTVGISPTGTKTVAGPAVRTDSLCARID